MAQVTLASISKDIAALHQKVDGVAKGFISEGEEAVAQLETPAWWKAHLGWAIACGACLVIGWMVRGAV